LSIFQVLYLTLIGKCFVIISMLSSLCNGEYKLKEFFKFWTYCMIGVRVVDYMTGNCRKNCWYIGLKIAGIAQWLRTTVDRKWWFVALYLPCCRRAKNRKGRQRYVVPGEKLNLFIPNTRQVGYRYYHKTFAYEPQIWDLEYSHEKCIDVVFGFVAIFFSQISRATFLALKQKMAEIIISLIYSWLIFLIKFQSRK
jgi:hypothetical protein